MAGYDERYGLSRIVGLLFILYVALAAVFAFAPRQGAQSTAPHTRLEQLLMLDGLALDGRLLVAGERGQVFLSDDGAEWRAVATPTRATLTALAAIDARRLVAVGHDEVILRSEDGGEYWTLVHEVPGADGPLLAVWFDADGRGLAVGAYGRMLESRDGGLSWEGRVLAVGDPHLNAIARGPGGRLFLAGEAGTLLRSRADPPGWEVLDAPYDGSFFGLLPIPGDALLAFGMRGHLYRSRDAGDTWEALDTGSTSALFGGRVLADGRALLVGQNGLLLALEGEGHTPVPLQVPGRRSYTALLPIAGRGDLLLMGEGGVHPVPPGRHEASP